MGGGWWPRFWVVREPIGCVPETSCGTVGAAARRVVDRVEHQPGLPPGLASSARGRAALLLALREAVLPAKAP